MESVLLNADFISISKSNEEDWQALKTILTAKIGTSLQKSISLFKSEKIEINKLNEKISPVEKEIIELLETKVKPAVASHGGDIIIS